MLREAARRCTLLHALFERLPAVASELRRATATFDAIWYGGRPAGPDDEQLLRALAQRVAGPHRVLVSAGAPVSAGTLNGSVTKQ